MRSPAILFVTLFLLALSGCAASQSGVVLRTDDWVGTLKIDGEVYRMTRHTQLFGADGGPIQLHEVPTIAHAGVGVRRTARARVDFQAREVHGKWYLDRLWVRRR